jgi:hypothetical protein
MSKLNQIIAIEKGIKSKSYSTITELHKQSQKYDLFNGMTRIYRKKDDEGEDFPTERKKVQLNTNELLIQMSVALTELFDITLTKDATNCYAKADIVIDGEVIDIDVPATYLLFMEKQINDIKTFVEKLPVLDESEDWSMDNNSGFYKTDPTSTHKTKKIQKPIVLAEATKEHPAQVSLASEDIVVGYWDTVKYSSAIPAPRKKEMLHRIDELAKAVKCAREHANSVETVNRKIGEKVFEYILLK